jgi:hypothetical protein
VEAPRTPDDGRVVAYRARAGAAVGYLPSGRDVAVSAFAVDYAGNASEPRSLVLQGTDVVAGVTPSRLVHGEEATLEGRVTDADTGGAIGGALVEVHTISLNGGRWRTAASLTADDKGVFRTTLEPRVNRRYVVVFRGSPGRIGAAEGYRSLVVRVAPRLGLRVDRATGPARSARTLVARVSPRSTNRVVLQRRDHGAWRDVRGARVDDGVARFTVRPTRTAVFRAFVPREERVRLAGASPAVRVEVDPAAR